MSRIVTEDIGKFSQHYPKVAVIVTASAGGRDDAMTAAWHSSISFRPPIYGVAITYQYVPTNKPPAGKMPYEEFKKWHGHWYGTYAPETFAPLIRPGHAVVIDAQGNRVLTNFEKMTRSILNNCKLNNVRVEFYEKDETAVANYGGGVLRWNLYHVQKEVDILVGILDLERTQFATCCADIKRLR
jgi:hypothetical protein